MSIQTEALGGDPRQFHGLNLDLLDFLLGPSTEKLPTVTELDSARGRLRFGANIIRNPGQYLPVALGFQFNWMGGIFLPRANEVVVEHGGDDIVKAHEYAHWWIDKRNPKLLNWSPGAYFRDCFSFMRGGGSDLPEQLERLSVDRCVHEGIATYVGIQYGVSTQNDQMRDEAVRRHYYHLTGSRSTVPDHENVAQTLKASQETLETLVTLPKLALAARTDEQAVDEFIKLVYPPTKLVGLLRNSQQPYYNLGYNFVLGVINQLRQHPLSSQEVIQRIVDNPPETLDQIYNPTQFARQLSDPTLLL